MNTNERRTAILQEIIQNNKPISASTLAQKYSVSRQIVVGDIAILRASQHPIIATPRGYLYQQEKSEHTYVVACTHDEHGTLDELQTIVDCGGTIENVIVTHPIYGELVGTLHISSRLDIEEFMEKCKQKKARNLSEISGGVHLHTIVCRNEEHFLLIKEALNKKGYLYKK